MEDNDAVKLIDNFIHKATADSKPPNMNINGFLVTDKNGLILASEDVTNDCSGSIALLSDMASALFERPAIVCLENGNQKLIIREAGKTVFSVYTEAARR